MILNFRLKSLIIAFILIFLINLIIFFYREKGFDYIKYASKKELYRDKTDKKFLHKWSEENAQFTSEEIELGITILKRHVGIDTILESKDKVTRIAAWIYSTFSDQSGTPSDTLMKLSPSQLYSYLINHKDKKLWCGHFQSMFGFFSTCAGLVNRYIEIVPSNLSLGDYHEINEVYLPDQNKWAMVDVTRNRVLIKNDSQVLSAADYFDYRLNQPSKPLLVTRSTGLHLTADSVYQGPDLTERYFNSNYKLRYYRIMYSSDIYKPITKIKGYIFGDPWYEMYDPLHPHSNFLFRIRQFFFFVLLVSTLLLLLTLLRHGKNIKIFTNKKNKPN